MSSIRRSALWALALALLAPEATIAQASDTVRVLLTGDGAAVEQRLAPEGDAIRALALRIEGQTLEVYEVVREGERLLDASLTPGRRAYSLEVTSGAPIVIRYAVSGSLDRIPLFVAAGAAELTVARDVEEPYLVRLEGTAEALDALDLGTSLPRLRPVGGDAAEARLSSVPALVRLSPGRGLSFARLADLVALTLIGLGIAWAWHAARLETSHSLDLE